MALTDGLISVWPFDSNGNDSVGSTNLTLTSPAAIDTSTKKLGAGSLDVNGNSSGFADNSSPDVALAREGAATFSISMWVYPISGGWAGPIVGMWGDDTFKYTDQSWLFKYDNTGTKITHVFINAAADGSTSGSAVTTLTEDAWNHYILTRNGLTLTAYVNGTKTTPSALSSGFETFPDNAGYIMRVGTNETAQWNGQVDEINVWNRVLTDAEASELYNSGAGLAYPFASGGGVIPDASRVRLGLGLGI